MKKFKSLLLGVVMMAGLTAISATAANSACFPYTFSCGEGHLEGGVVCGSDTMEMIAAIYDVAVEVCSEM